MRLATLGCDAHTHIILTLLLQSPVCQNEDSLHSFPDDMSDDLTQPAKTGRGRGGRRDRRHKKLDAQVGQLSCMLVLCV